MEKTIEKIIDELSILTGVVSEYWDIFGKKYSASIESKTLILKAMGLDVSSVESASQEIKRLKSLPWTRFIEPIYVVNGQPFFVHIYLNLESHKEDKTKIIWKLASSKGMKIKYQTIKITIVDERLFDNKRYVKIALPCTLPQGIEKFEIGYYRLDVSASIDNEVITGQSKVALCPEHCYYPFESKDDKFWGLSLNLYSLRSKTNFGVGDLGDLKYCISEVKKGGGSFVGINPLHAITNQRPFGISPYSPISKFYRNFIYINLTDVEGFKGLPEKSKKALEDIRNSQYIDYESIAEIKFNILKKTFDWFYKEHYSKKTQLATKFDKFLLEEGEILEKFALYCAIADFEGKSKGFNKPLYSWRQWDDKYHNPKSNHTEDFQKRHYKNVLFYSYIQWLLSKQIEEIFDLSKPMPIGIYNDLAVGSIRDGFDEWVYQDAFASSVNVGAPPDDCNPSGQDWGFPPLSPLRLKEYAYEPFIIALKKNMQSAGALRIDHALGLFRMFWIPLGKKSSEGVYVEYPYEDILKIIALESQLNKTIVIAEDLGTCLLYTS
ncbi:MAG: 4-alpha-glucanotransferase, partial [Thermodesulfovibrionales bacterium]|nr:4-alpha-glucanotransferase [Thermodesulfovibrionales bacterium]